MASATKEKKRASFELGEGEGAGRGAGCRGEGTAEAKAVRWGRARCFSGSEKRGSVRLEKRGGGGGWWFQLGQSPDFGGGSAGRSLGLCRRCSGRPWEGLMTAGEARSSFHLKSTTLPLCEDWTGRVEKTAGQRRGRCGRLGER